MKSQGMSWSGRLAVVALCAAAVAVLVGSDRADAQQGKYITEAASRLGKAIEAANKDGFKLDNDKFSIGGGWIKQSTDNWVSLYTLTLTKGKSYRFIAAGDIDAKDVDIEVKDSTGKVVASDTGTAPEAIVNFTPPDTGKYLVRVRLYGSANNVPCVCLAIAMVK